MPSGADLGLFLISDGKLERNVEIVRMPTLGDIVKRYQETFTKAAKEEITRRMEDIHLAQLMRIIGAKRPLNEITTGTIQQFIDTRSRERHNGHPLKAKTIKKAVATLRYVWNWSFRQGQARMRYPGHGTEVEEKGGTLEAAPIEDEAKVEERRKVVGFRPWRSRSSSPAATADTPRNEPRGIAPQGIPFGGLNPKRFPRVVECSPRDFLGGFSEMR